MTQSEKRRHQATHSATSNALSAKTARACDSCLRARARCYCAADDAFLCQECDSVVHSANSLAGRHERVQLKTSSTCSAFKACLGFDEMLDDGPAWHDGCKRRARTPRGGGGKDDQRRCRLKTGPLVPEIGTPSSSSECVAVDEEHLIHRVPIYDQVLSEFCTPAAGKDDVKPEAAGGSQPVRGTVCSEGLTGFHTHDMDLGEFEYDVENLLGHGLDGEHCMEGLGFNTIDSTEKGSGSGGELCPPTEDHIPVKEEEMYVDSATADIKFDCGSPWESGNMSDEDTVREQDGKKKIMLKLDYESVIAAWSTQKSPWANGERPNLDCGDYFPDVMGMIWAVGACAGRNGAPQTTACGGREARVLRYREKRRTRLFSKKIRYEVRKLNAEKRPRMKGRFVKRAASFAASTATKITSATATYAAPQYIF